MTVYATVANLNNHLPVAQRVDTGSATAVAEAERLLARASRTVDRAVRAQYPTDDNGAPTIAEVTNALRDATVAQYEQWIEVGEHNDIDGLAGSHIAVAGYTGGRAPRIAPRAFDVLHLAGLTEPVRVAEAPLPEEP